MLPPASESALMTPTDRHGKHDLEDLKRRSSIGESEDGTAATECESTPTTLSDSNMEFSPFMLPEMDEGDLEETDDATMVSAMSRMSAPFIQFAPSILPGAIPEEALSQVGLNTVAAENKPSNVACVNTINFLSEPEPKEEEAAPEAAPPIQIDLKPSTRRKKRGSVTKSPPKQGLQRRLSGQGLPNGGFISSPPPVNNNNNDDGSIGPSSVRSAPARSAGRSRVGGGFKRVQMGHLGGPRGIPSINGGRPIQRRDPSLDMMAAPPSMMGRQTTGRRRDPSIDMMAGPPMAMMGLPRGPSRTSSLPAQHHGQPTRRSSSMLPTTSSSHHHHHYGGGGGGGGDDVSVASGASRNSARSMPASRSSMGYNQHIRNDPRRGSMGRRGSGSHGGPPPTAPTQLSKAQSKEQQRKEKKKKGGMFSKMFSNHIQTDFNGQVVDSVAQEVEARAAVPGGAMDDNSDYGVMPSRSSEGRSDSQSVTQSVPSEEGSRSRTSRVSATQRTSITESSTSASAHNGVRLRSDSFGNNNGPPPPAMMMMMDNPCVPDSMKVAEPPRAAALVRSNSGRMIRAPEDDSGAKKGRMKNLFKRNKDKKATGVESAPVVDAACGYA